MTVKTTCSYLVCSAFHKSLMNYTLITIEYRYNHKYCTYIYVPVRTFNVFILTFSFNTTSMYYIENAFVKRVHTCNYYSKEHLFHTEISMYITCHRESPTDCELATYSEKLFHDCCFKFHFEYLS